MKRILLCEDNPEGVALVRAILKAGELYAVDDSATGQGCLERYPRGYDLVLLDLGLPDINGLEVLQRLKALDPAVRVIVTTASESVETAVAALRAGAVHYIRKPIRLADLRAAVQEALVDRGAAESDGRTARGRSEGAEAKEPRSLVVPAPHVQVSSRMREVYALVDRVADKNVSVLIQGPTGSGKEHVAKLLHEKSGRQGPLVSVSCPAIPVTLAESTLFGHEKGAFTGAASRQTGKLVQAHGGTLFLDEIADLTPEIQVKLLRVLQEREVEPLGSAKPVPIDVRVVAASSRDLRREVKEGRFREDLLYRLADVDVAVPALKERVEDIAELARYFAAEYAADHGEPPRELAPELLRRLAAYDWPGNVRELRSLVRRLIIMAPGKGPVDVDASLGRYLKSDVQRPGLVPVLVPAAPAAELDTDEPVDVSLKNNEIELIKRALHENDNNVTRAAQALQIGRATLYRKMKRYGLAS